MKIRINLKFIFLKFLGNVIIKAKLMEISISSTENIDISMFLRIILAL